MKPPKYTIQELQHAVDERMFLRANKLHRDGAVGKIREDRIGYTATVRGGSPYFVSVSRTSSDVGHCDCYMGQNEKYCKHMLALSLAVLHESGEMSNSVEVSPTNLEEAKKQIQKGLRKIRTYTGPSSTWFRYQTSLSIGSGIIVDAIKNLPANKDIATYLWQLILSLSEKLATGGVDDSDGTIGSCIYTVVEKCAQMAQVQPDLFELIKGFTADDTGFGFEEDLKLLLKKK